MDSLTNIRHRLTAILTAAAFTATALTACHEAEPTVDELLAEATEAMADKDYGHMQTLCDHAITHMADTDTTAVDGAQAGRLAILYMILSDHRNEDENVAVAAQCLRYAYEHSADSLRTFSAGLPLDEQRHFELLRRIAVSIDNPIDLMGEEFTEEDTALIAE